MYRKKVVKKLHTNSHYILVMSACSDDSVFSIQRVNLPHTHGYSLSLSFPLPHLQWKRGKRVGGLAQNWLVERKLGSGGGTRVGLAKPPGLGVYHTGLREFYPKHKIGPTVEPKHRRLV